MGMTAGQMAEAEAKKAAEEMAASTETVVEATEDCKECSDCDCEKED